MQYLPGMSHGERCYDETRQFTCKKCKDRNDPNHFIKNNMHPLWYEIEDDGSLQMDSNGKKIP